MPNPTIVVSSAESEGAGKARDGDDLWIDESGEEVTIGKHAKDDERPPPSYSEYEIGPGESELEESDDDEEAGLDPEGKRQKRKRRARETSLDRRVAGDTLSLQDERKLADLAVLKRSAVNAVLIALWYIFSISISVVSPFSQLPACNSVRLADPKKYNKWMFSPDNLDFRFPLFTTSMHMLVQFALSSATLFFFPRFRPAHAVEEEEFQKASQEEEEENAPKVKKPVMTPWFYITRIGPCGTATGLDIGLGNMSLKFITLTFFSKTPIGSSLSSLLSPIFLFL